MSPTAAHDANPETDAYHKALEAGRLLVRTCRACGEAHHYPRANCPFCFSGDTEFRDAAGRGRIYSFTRLRTKGGADPVLAYVTLDEGPTLMTSIVDADFADLAIDRRVCFVVRPGADGAAAPMFILD